MFSFWSFLEEVNPKKYIVKVSLNAFFFSFLLIDCIEQLYFSNLLVPCRIFCLPGFCCTGQDIQVINMAAITKRTTISHIRTYLSGIPSKGCLTRFNLQTVQNAILTSMHLLSCFFSRDLSVNMQKATKNSILTFPNSNK